METGSQLKSLIRGTEIEPATPDLHTSGLSTNPQRLLCIDYQPFTFLISTGKQVLWQTVKAQIKHHILSGSALFTKTIIIYIIL